MYVRFHHCFTLGAGAERKMTDCTVSVTSGDGKIHTVEVKASSLFDAVDQAAQQWARLWWYRGDAVAEVLAGNRQWGVRLERVWLWWAGQGSARFRGSG